MLSSAAGKTDTHGSMNGLVQVKQTAAISSAIQPWAGIESTNSPFAVRKDRDACGPALHGYTGIHFESRVRRG